MAPPPAAVERRLAQPRPAEPPARKATLFQRLAGLVARREP
jgi:hypothetical protein